MKRSFSLWPALALVLCACSSSVPLSRTPDPRDAVPSGPNLTSAAEAELWSHANAVFESRCVVCHGCYDSPCQLKLEGYAGASRGASTVPVYETTRLIAASPTRLGIDAHLTSEWRAKGFHAVVPDTTRDDPRKSVMLQLLNLKREHPLRDDIDFDQTFTFGLDRKARCVTSDEVAEFAAEHPLWGMPYALPVIEGERHAALRAWIEAGAPNGAPLQLSAATVDRIHEWESYLNEPSLRRQLSARYLYEHLFLASLYFRGVDEEHFFRLVRSHTPPGFPPDEIPTRRPFDDPGRERFYYRFVPREGTRLAKTQMPYALDVARMQRYRALFDAPNYEVAALPSYDPEVASNPFRAFAELPVSSRYRFMLDEAEFIMMGFIKGPVCRGQVALNVIQERFWISFLDPGAPFASQLSEKLGALQMHDELPAEAGSNALPTAWFAEASQHFQYVQRRNELWANAQRSGATVLDTRLIWDGEGKNDNAGLTVFRHFDSATVVKGFVGGPPKTAWVVDYPMFERIHYLLVAGFDVFGNVGHQLMTRMYMDFLRMEGEANYLAFLPSARRAQLTYEWYLGVRGDAEKRVYDELVGLTVDGAQPFDSAQPELTFDAQLEQRIGAALAHDYDSGKDDVQARALQPLNSVRGAPATLLAETSIIEVTGKSGAARYFSVLRDSAHTNVAELFDEEDRRATNEDSLCVVPGFLGAYPHALFQVRESELEVFVKSVTAMRTENDYRALRKRFGVLRNSPEFWAFSDRMNAAYRVQAPLEWGMLDYNRLEAP